MHLPRTATYYLSFTLLFILNLWISNTAFSQSSQYKNYGVKDGLPSSEVYSVMQDSKGYMWFGTDHGASRFDGYSFKSFTPSDGLADPMVLDCMEDYKGRIWFRSLSGRLSYYYHDSIFRLPVNDTLFHLLKGNIITSISVDSEDNIYISAHNLKGIVHISIRKKYSISYINLPDNIVYIGVPNSGALIEGSTSLPMNSDFKSTHFNPTLNIYALKNDHIKLLKTFSFYWNGIPFYHSLLRGQAIRLSNKKIALSLLLGFMIIDDTIISYSYHLHEDINKLYADKSGRTWVIGNNEAPLYYWHNEIVEPRNLKFLKKMEITSIAEDNEKGLWFTTLNDGIYYIKSLNFNTWSIENGLPWNKINYVGTSKDSTIALSSLTNNTICFLHNDSIIKYKIPLISNGSSVTSIVINPDKSIWVSSTLGISVFNNLVSFKAISTTSFFGGYALTPDIGNTYWYNGYNNVMQIGRDKNSIKTLKNIIFKSKIFGICKSNVKGIWVASMNGLLYYNNDTIIDYGNKFQELKNAIECVKESPTGDLWMATRDTGVIMMHGNTLLHLTTTDGLLSNLCKCLCIDYKGSIWIGSKEGLSHILVHTDNSGVCHVDAIKNMNNDNLIEVNSIACDSNMVYVATNNGLTSFDMNKIEINKTPPPIYITSVKVNNKIFSSSISSLALHYDENYISLNFLGIAYRNAGNIQYRYKMTGIDTGWIYTKYTSVQYPKLEPGNYTFNVSAMNNDGIWSTSPATFSFIIAPPFWATWWARTIMGLIIIALIYWRIKDVEKREKRKTEVNKQLATFELKELKAQLDPHFLFNSLNTLTHLVEKVPAQAPEFVEELSTFYRYTLLHRNSEFTELKAEIEQAERYLKLLRIRFGDQLKVSWHIDEQYKNYLIPTNSLQLLFENITKHNVIMPDNPLWANIATTLTHSLVIKNQLRLKPVPPLSNGIGLNSINERYRLMASKKINITQTIESFSVELPLISPQEYENINY